MGEGSKKFKIILITIAVASITFLQYVTKHAEPRHHLFYEGLYFLPVILAAFWFGLRGSLTTSLGITILNLPYIHMYWKGFSADDFNNVMEMALYNAAAIILGILKDREQEGQRRLREAESLAAMGKAVSGLAHDMKTPLVAIGGFSRLLKKHLDEDDPYREKVDVIIEETLRLENMIKEMLDFTRPLQLYPAKGDVNQVVIQSLTVIAEMARDRNVTINHQLSQDLPPASFDAMRLKQALINLLTNAVDASPEGETVTIHSCQNRRNILLDVTDSGPGIPSDQREEIFSPFFTTKQEGTGLGLPIAKKIVEAHQGYIEVLDNLETGITFRVIIPVAEP